MLRRLRNSRKAHASEAMQTTTKAPTMGVPLADIPSMAVPTTPTIAIGRHTSPRTMGAQGFVLVSLCRAEDDERRGTWSLSAIC